MACVGVQIAGLQSTHPTTGGEVFLNCGAGQRNLMRREVGRGEEGGVLPFGVHLVDGPLEYLDRRLGPVPTAHFWVAEPVPARCPHGTVRLDEQVVVRTCGRRNHPRCHDLHGGWVISNASDPQAVVPVRTHAPKGTIVLDKEAVIVARRHGDYPRCHDLDGGRLIDTRVERFAGAPVLAVAELSGVIVSHAPKGSIGLEIE